MWRDVPHLFGLAVVQEDVAIGIGVDFAEGEVAAVRRDVGKVITTVVLEDHLTPVVVRLVLVHIEEAVVALVGPDEERAVVLRPAVEGGLELFAGRQIGDLAGRILYVHMIELVAAAIARIKEALVAGEVAHGEDVIVRRVGQLDGVAAIHLDFVSVYDAGLVAADQKLAFVG